MFLQTVVRGSGRVILGMAIVAAAVPFISTHAEARKVRIKSAGAPSAVVRQHNRGAKQSEPAADSAKSEDGAADEPATAEALPAVGAPRAIVERPVARSKPIETVVAGCSTGMMCVVCVAGCAGDVNVIVHAERRPEK